MWLDLLFQGCMDAAQSEQVSKPVRVFCTAFISFVFLIAICIGFIILQIRLSKMDSKWPGLVLPAITLLLSLVAAITVFARADIGAYGNMWNVVLSAFIAFLSNNVSTIVLAGIYLYQRDKINRRAELARMNVQDL